MDYRNNQTVIARNLTNADVITYTMQDSAGEMVGFINTLFAVQIARDHKTGRKVSESWSLDGRLHRDDDLPALTYYDPKTGAVAQEFWYRHGLRHREGGPCSRSFNAASGLVLEESWMIGGELHRDGYPAEIEYAELTGTVIREEWWLRGLRHREGGPAVTERYSKSRSITCQEWHFMGEMHRQDGPAGLYYDDAGRLIDSCYFRLGVASTPMQPVP